METKLGEKVSKTCSMHKVRLTTEVMIKPEGGTGAIFGDGGTVWRVGV